jgi:hypothetical protein
MPTYIFYSDRGGEFSHDVGTTCKEYEGDDDSNLGISPSSVSFRIFGIEKKSDFALI